MLKKKSFNLEMFIMSLLGIIVSGFTTISLITQKEELGAKGWLIMVLSWCLLGISTYYFGLTIQPEIKKMIERRRRERTEKIWEV